MIQRISGSVALVFSLLVVVVSCSTDDSPGESQDELVASLEKVHLDRDALTKGLETLEDQFLTAQSDLAVAQQALQVTLDGLTRGLSALQGDQKVSLRVRTALSLDTSNLQTGLATAQRELTDTGLLLDDLKSSFFLTRNEVELNTREVQIVQDEISKLQKAQVSTADAVTALEGDLDRVKQTNVALQAKVDGATVYAETSDAYFDYATAITQAARNAALLALDSWVGRTQDDDLQSGFDNWVQASTLEERQLLSVFLDVLGTKLLLALGD